MAGAYNASFVATPAELPETGNYQTISMFLLGNLGRFRP
ncbi:hypothetical protein Z945_589 [Sulfitobacter noctilucae]|nr:hypothetical protein Z945_589 [Sulfitobacter noctilucae]